MRLRTGRARVPAVRRVAGVLAGAALAAGCAPLLLGAGAAAGAGAYAYVRGELQSAEEAPLGRAHAAAEGAMEDLQFAITESRLDGATAEVAAITSDDRKVRVKLERASGEVTRVAIRVGLFGDQALSLLVLQKMRDRLSPL